MDQVTDPVAALFELNLAGELAHVRVVPTERNAALVAAVIHAGFAAIEETRDGVWVTRLRAGTGALDDLYVEALYLGRRPRWDHP